MARFLPISLSSSTTPLVQQVSPVTGGKIYKDTTKCFSTKVVYDQPGTYTFSMPTTATCAKVVLVGGGGKPVANCTPCCSFAGAGGGYSEKYFSGPAGSTFTIVVGAQEQTTSSSCNSVATHSASGAVCCTPGTGTGGDWNSAGGDPGMTMQYGGCNNSGCGACICCTTCAICGYCFIIAYKDSQNGGGVSCCQTLLPGGGSAGSPVRLKGGNGWCVCGNCWSGVAGGGGGIGQCHCVPWNYNCCSCACFQGPSPEGSQTCLWGTAYMGSASGGGGTNSGCTCYAEFQSSWNGICQFFAWNGGYGGSGGPNACEGMPTKFQYGTHHKHNPSYGSQCGFSCPNSSRYRNDPVKVCWWDINEICGTGAPSYTHENQCTYNGYLGAGWFTNRPSNAGEGAGTGGVMTYWCLPQYHGWNLPPSTAVTNMINFPLLCYIGVTGQCNLLPKLVDKIFPYHMTCAGTLGGSGGFGWCGYDSKAGFGGGGGQVKWSIVCVCSGTGYDCCGGNISNGLLNPAPTRLDWLVSNAGSGLAIIYYRED